jgi:glycine betaine transporter
MTETKPPARTDQQEKHSKKIHTVAHNFRDLSAMHTPSHSEDKRYGLASVDQEIPHRRGREHHVTSVFWIALSITVAIIALCLAFPAPFAAAASGACSFIAANFGWYYLLLVALIVIVCLVLMISPAGAITLGDPGEKPRFSFVSWLAMLFSAGMGIGLVFWGAAEPLSHYAVSAAGGDVGTEEALRDAFQYSFFHWGISAWAIYGLVALALAYFRFRKKEKSLLSVTLKPLFGKKVEGPWGKAIDSITAFATIVGVATSLGMGAMQINGGLNYLFGVPVTSGVQLVIIAITTVCFIASAFSGLSRGVRILSNANVLIAVGLIAAAMVVGPAAHMMDVLVTSVGNYLQNFLAMSLDVAPFNDAHRTWINSWTIFYWAWWIAWAPFVGVFIARISRGRSIRAFLGCVIFVPAIFSSIWFAVFGTLSTGAQMAGTQLAQLSTETVLFGTLAAYPAGQALSIIAVVLIFSFFITSADSATFVLGMITEDGCLEPHRRTKAVWGVLLSLIASVLLVNGGLKALQNVLIITAFPFSIVMLLMTIALCRELHHERRMMGLYLHPAALPDADTPFRSYEDDPPDDPVAVIQRDIAIATAVTAAVEESRDRAAETDVAGEEDDT